MLLSLGPTRLPHGLQLAQQVQAAGAGGFTILIRPLGLFILLDHSVRGIARPLTVSVTLLGLGLIRILRLVGFLGGRLQS